VLQKGISLQEGMAHFLTIISFDNFPETLFPIFAAI